MHTVSVRRHFSCHILFIPHSIFCWVSLPTYSTSNSIPCHVEYDVFHNTPFSYMVIISVMVNYTGFYYTWNIIKTKIVFWKTVFLSSPGITSCSVLLQSLLQPATKNDTTHLMNQCASLFHKPLISSKLQVQALFRAIIPFLIQFMQQPQ